MDKIEQQPPMWWKASTQRKKSNEMLMHKSMSMAITNSAMIQFNATRPFVTLCSAVSEG
jgi:hypothetical protein